MVEKSEGAPNRYRIEAVDRALSLLMTLAADQGSSASQLAAKLGANRSLVFRLLSTLSERGFVSKDDANLYWLGPQLLYLGVQSNHHNALVAASNEEMDRLAQETGEAVGLAVRDYDQGYRLAFRESSQLIRLPPEFSAHNALHVGGGGKLLLAYAPQELIDEVIDKHLDEFAPPTLRRREDVLAQLAKMRRDGYHASIGEVHPDAASINAAIFDGSGAMIGILAVMGPTSRFDALRRGPLIKRLVDAAKRISARLP